MGYLKYVKAAFRKPTEAQETLQRERLIAWRAEPVTVRVEHPTRIDRARSLGYKAKQGVIVVRQRIGSGGHTRPSFAGGRTPRKFHRKLNLKKNYQQLAEERAAKKYVNCEVLGSYQVAADGKNYWYEVILVDRRHPQVLADKQLIGIAAQRGRTERGISSSGRKGRGLRRKGKGAEKIRPSLRSHNRLH